MNRFQFQLCSLVVIILLFTPRIQAIRRNLASGTSAESPTHPGQQVFHPGSSAAPFTGQSRQFEEKRRVPTGSNPLHNRR
ncbi:Clavata3/esr-related 20, putative [Theobroma cacao]|uniref:Clavata3/esr-related 20, putative n=1 Tax=Theobroma cacao TaxID=3641 RepID=A0A061DKT6_THECC|nr:Clavata3/esr-related 20, putative [Theobroma cacao]